VHENQETSGYRETEVDIFPRNPTPTISHMINLCACGAEDAEHAMARDMAKTSRCPWMCHFSNT
jgi:hypothetical protein